VRAGDADGLHELRDVGGEQLGRVDAVRLPRQARAAEVDGVAGELPGVVSHLERVAGLVGRETRDEDERFAFALDLVVDLDVVGLHYRHRRLPR
jgi:hypothetical protein